MTFYEVKYEVSSPYVLILSFYFRTADVTEKKKRAPVVDRRLAVPPPILVAIVGPSKVRDQYLSFRNSGITPVSIAPCDDRFSILL